MLSSSVVVVVVFVFIFFGKPTQNSKRQKVLNLNRRGQPEPLWDWSAAVSHGFDLNETRILIVHNLLLTLLFYPQYL